MGIRKPNSAGLVVSTAGPDLLHTLSILGPNAGQGFRSAFIRTIHVYNNTGADITVQFGTLNRAVAPAFVQLMADMVFLDTFHTDIPEQDIPMVEFRADLSALAAGRTGNIYMQASAVGLLINLTVEEIG